MTQRSEYQFGALHGALRRSNRKHGLCAAWLLAAALVAVPATTLGAQAAASASADDKGAAAAEMTEHGKASQAEAPNDGGDGVDVGAPEVPARAGGIAGEVDRESWKRFIPHKDKHDLFANELEEADVITGDGKDIGEVQDVLIGPDGQVRALIVEVGGMLGLGEKKVAVRYDRFERDVNDEGMLQLKLQATEHELREAPRFIPVREYDNARQTESQSRHE